jgi:cation diffusion facilitator family transporter
MSAPGAGNRAIVAALAANLGIATLKFGAFLLTRSSSMLAESIHSVVDSGNQLLLLVGGKRARQTADAEHPFGYGRTRYLYGFIVSVVLFSVGGLFALYEGYHKWVEPEPIEDWKWVPVAVLIGAIGLESYSFRTAIGEANPLRAGRSWVRYIRESRSPELPVVLLEDFAALIGLVLALLGVGLTLLTHDGRWDAVGTALIGVLLVGVAVVLAIETSSMLVGEAATPEQEAAIRTALVGAGVLRVIHLRTMHLGPEELLVAAKISVSGEATGQQIAAAIDAAEARVRGALDLPMFIFLEPDLDRGDGDGARTGPAATGTSATA